MIRCVWCGERLLLDPERGWVHADDGQVYKKDDGHCALPDRPGMPAGVENYAVGRLDSKQRLGGP